MGMRDYAVSDYGMLLNAKTMKLLAESICEDYTSEKYDKDPYEFNDSVECRIGCIDYMSSFTGEAIPIDDFGHDVFLADSEVYDELDPIYFIYANRQPSLFSASYCCIEELVAEFKDLLMRYLPSDFDYRDNIRHLVGTYYG